MKMLSSYISGTTSHIGITVPDLDEARAFYGGLLGFEEIWTLQVSAEMLDTVGAVPEEERIKNTAVQFLVPGGSRIELHHYEPMGDVGGTRLNNQGLNHLAFSVQDVQAEYERLKEAGVKFRAEPVPMDFGDHQMSGFTTAYFEDPWGLTLQLLGPTPGAAQDNDERRTG